MDDGKWTAKPTLRKLEMLRKIKGMWRDREDMVDRDSVMQVSARCYCGQVNLTAHIDPQKVFVCFCTDCQKMSGTAFRTVVPAVLGSVQVQGDVQHYTKTAESGNRRVQGFCPVCGSSMYSKTEGDTPAYVLRVGGLAQAAQLKPSVKLWQRSQWAWTEELEQVVGCQRQELF